MTTEACGARRPVPLSTVSIDGSVMRWLGHDGRVTGASNLLCVDGLQYAFVMTTWESRGDEHNYASELLCPTCGTVPTRETEGDGWRWNPPEGPG